MLIYKIFRDSEWLHLQEHGETLGAPIDLSDGYIHFSTPQQAEETAAKHFAGEHDLWLIVCDTDALSAALAWEVSRGGAKFPHLYRALRMADVIRAERLPLIDGVHRFPDVAQ